MDISGTYKVNAIEASARTLNERRSFLELFQNMQGQPPAARRFPAAERRRRPVEKPSTEKQENEPKIMVLVDAHEYETTA